jgi:hypothetical protein
MATFSSKIQPTGVITSTSTSTLSNKTISDVVFTGAIDEKVYNLTGTDVDPANGTIQKKTLTGATTLSITMSEGESVTLMIDDGSAYAVTWPGSVTFVNNAGSAPTLATTGYTVFSLWCVGSTVYVALVGDGT